MVLVIFQKATSQVPISQLATSQMCNFLSGNFLKVWLGHLERRWLHCELWLKKLWSRLLRKEYTWEVAAWEIAQLERFHLGKYQREVAAWEKVFGKLSTIKLLHCS